jgi:nitrous oxide reductase accessory protein NosL
MKKVIAIMLAVCALGVFMSGCSKSEEGGTTEPAKTEGK